MQNLKSKIKNLFKKKVVKISSVIVLIIIVLFFIFGKGNTEPYEFIITEKGSLIQEVDVTGKIKPVTEVELAFKNGGKIAQIYAEVSDKVFIGQTLLRLDNGDSYAQLQWAEAQLRAQQAKLDELKRGSRPEEIQIQTIKVENAKKSLTDAKQGVIDKLQDSYIKSDDAIRNKTDQMFNNPRSENPDLKLLNTSSQTKIDLEWKRFVIEKMFSPWKISLGNLSVNNNLESDIATAKKNLSDIKSFLESLAFTLNETSAGPTITQTTLDGWKSDISTARTNLSTVIINLSTAEEKLRTAESSLSLAEEELALEKAGTSSEQIRAQEAEIEKAQADINRYQAELSKTIIYSPINGIITKQDGKIGEIVSANTNIISVMSDSIYQIEVDIPEADISKIKIGDKAKFTLDSYGDEILFDAFVIKIDPAETVIEGVSTYKTTLQLEKNDERIRSGMTANLDIMTAQKENIIAIPQRAVISKNGDKFVRVFEGTVVVEKIVKTGLRGSNGDVEILSGLNEGEKVITYTKAIN